MVASPVLVESHLQYRSETHTLNVSASCSTCRNMRRLLRCCLALELERSSLKEDHHQLEAYPIPLGGKLHRCRTSMEQEIQHRRGTQGHGAFRTYTPVMDFIEKAWSSEWHRTHKAARLHAMYTSGLHLPLLLGTFAAAISPSTTYP